MRFSIYSDMLHLNESLFISSSSFVNLFLDMRVYKLSWPQLKIREARRLICAIAH